jgi:hypothetical protein
MRDFTSFPGEELIRKGLEDLKQDQESVEALLVSIGSPRLRFNGVEIPRAIPDAEHRLYFRLSSEFGDDAHSRYNALIRRLVSFEQALECAK